MGPAQNPGAGLSAVVLPGHAADWSPSLVSLVPLTRLQNPETHFLKSPRWRKVKFPTGLS